eukprot:scaffold1581_cov169-Amphora_coffeaeformis.AAC.23
MLSEKEKSQLENKIQAEARASETLNPSTDLHILYLDKEICVTSKPSGILSVPGPRRNPSLASLVYDLIQPGIDLDQMVVHRLDMDTSGILVYALSEDALKQLHIDFRDRKVHKVYEALLAGHFRTAAEVEIDVSLERDPFHPPFMRAAQPKDTTNMEVIHPTFQKFIDQAPKPSQTELRVLSLEFLPQSGLPVTRVRLIPKTGRTHQLRVHCASLGYPIVGDDIYGYNGAGDCGILFNDEKAKERLRIQRLIYEQGHSLCLHARTLCFHHPGTRAPLCHEATEVDASGVRPPSFGVGDLEISLTYLPVANETNVDIGQTRPTCQNSISNRDDKENDRNQGQKVGSRNGNTANQECHC